MADSGNLMQLVGSFIGIAIMLAIGIQILGNSVQDCSNLPGYDVATPANSTDWAAACIDGNTQTQAAYALLIIILIVVAAVAILSVIRLL